MLIYLFTTFPKSTETFLQREIIAMRARGVPLRIYSLWGGGGEFEGMPIHRFNLWRLLELLWLIPWIAVTQWRFFRVLLKGLFTRRAPSWINFWENMLGAGFAGVHYRAFRKLQPLGLHAAWGGAPATAAWCLRQMNGHRFSGAAHAYDIYEYGGDWWLREKLADAAFIHTSTDMAKASLVEQGLDPGKIHVIRRGLAKWPDWKPLRSPRTPLRLICVARLVAKKGFNHQLRIYQRLRDAGVSFEAVIIGDGPLRKALATQIEELDLASRVKLLGHLAPQQVWQRFAWADVLLHTGIVAPSGDRDGLPNVIPEAMAAGVIVVTSPAAATTEAVQDGVSGCVAEVDQPDEWVRILRRLEADDVFAEQLRNAARAWVLENYDAHRNAARLHGLFTESFGLK